MELRFILEHAEASVLTARQRFIDGDRERCEVMLEELGEWLTKRIEEGVLQQPNIDVKPAEPG